MRATEFESARRAMVVSQLRPNGVTDARVVDAMGRVPREDFVPDDYRAVAYADITVPLDDNQSLNSPMAIGRLLNEARIGVDDRVLVAASGAGYTAAVAKMLTPHVDTVDADGISTLSAQPYDAIIIDGAVEMVPDALIDRLARGGRLVTGLSDSGVTRLAVGRRGGSGFALTAFADVAVAVLPAFARPRSFVF